ncbi:MAG: peptidoglycan-associated lipoprotein [Sulfurimonas sp.]|nr:MAG: peptidoglycan-associated lipoprotein [Sulfurimonas sp.]
MKKVILSSIVIALLVFSGCADKDPVVDTSSQTDKYGTEASHSPDEVVGVNSETISSNESSVLNETTSDTNEMGMANLEKDMEVIYFDFDKFFIRTDMTDNIAKNADSAKTKASKYTIKLEGNCDEWGSDEYNFALGLKRANAVKKALVAEGINTSRITMVSYGESNPSCVDKTKACWSKNRRVELKLLP